LTCKPVLTPEAIATASDLAHHCAAIAVERVAIITGFKPRLVDLKISAPETIAA
tara:strand:- start:135 stop:296 length:162 start_codon:yes stop_codon:yes gene_type:complete